jgi:hypothetical protein
MIGGFFFNSFLQSGVPPLKMGLQIIYHACTWQLLPGSFPSCREVARTHRS